MLTHKHASCCLLCAVLAVRIVVVALRYARQVWGQRTRQHFDRKCELCTAKPKTMPTEHALRQQQHNNKKTNCTLCAAEHDLRRNGHHLINPPLIRAWSTTTTLGRQRRRRRQHKHGARHSIRLGDVEFTWTDVCFRAYSLLPLPFPIDYDVIEIIHTWIFMLSYCWQHTVLILENVTMQFC